ncbi:asparagine synthase (glutamine-hydrolyzing) [Pseudomonadota bacterium]
MCGIAAIFAHNPNAPRVDLTELKRLKDSMHNRGPDGSGEWINAKGSVGLAHTRLAIIDLSKKAAQPMASEDGKTIITFNGEIYNYPELKVELIQKGYHFKSNSDTEVLLNLYLEFGRDMLTKLRGMFAFAIWDEHESSLFCARDLYGIKPLYYCDDRTTLRVASQVRTLLAANIDSREQDPAGLAGFYLFGHIPEPFTLYLSIKALPAGSTLTLEAGGHPKIERYSRVSEIYHCAPLQAREKMDSLGAIENALVDSVRHHMVSDVPVGLFLSAGIDSGLILALMARAGHDQIRTITVTFDDYSGLENDEAPMAARVASTFGARHDTTVIEEAEIRSALPIFTEAMDQPSIDGLNTWLISRAASTSGIKVALSGVGGDELFGGYPSFSDIPRWQAVVSAGQKIPGLNRLASATLTSLGRLGMPIKPKLAALPRLANTWPGAYLVRRGLFMPWELRDVVGNELAEAGLEALRAVQLVESEIEPDPGNAFTRTATLESGLYMKNQLLRDTDWASMAHSLEVRTPLVDQALLKTLAFALKNTAGMVTKQQIAQKICADMPVGWSARNKTGFTVPIHKWLETVSDLDAWRRIPILKAGSCHWSRRWAYTVMSIARCAAV